MAKIVTATTMKELLKLRYELSQFKVLDPACGSGNFLYVAFRELARIDLAIMHRLQTEFSHSTFEKQAKLICAINAQQFFGLDNDPFAVELAKVTLMLAKKLAMDSAVEALSQEEHKYSKGTHAIEFDADQTLPLDNLDQNIVCADALFTDWPIVDAIIGNPPYQAKNKAQAELSAAYLHKVRARYPSVDGRADYCVYWFRIAHDHLKPGQRAGLVGTNTIRQNYSRIA
jgi:type I restriction-modification system DNA methylase subunit